LGVFDINKKFVTGDKNGSYDRGNDGFLGDDFFYWQTPNRVFTGYQWHSRSEKGNNSIEDWADIFQNWVFDSSFADNDAGNALESWVDSYMPNWIKLANGESLIPQRIFNEQ
jgi:hypothetical protein